MVKRSMSVLIFFAAFTFLFTNCEIDFAGFCDSTDLDIRLKAADEFVFVKDAWKNLGNLGNDYSFIVTSDTHITGKDAHGLEKLKNKIKGAKFIVVTGDITQSGTEEELKCFADIALDFGIPCYPVIGNHDIYFEHWENWRQILGSTRYRIDSDNTTLFILDSANGFLGESQINWFAAELKTAKENVFIFSHANFFSDQVPSPMQVQFTFYEERAWFISLLDDHCKAVITGHVHKKVYNKIQNTHFITQDDFITQSDFIRVHVKKSEISWEYETIND
ncbi:MAG: hypothetical protein Ta2B_04970 [Termitinemataceae bacterium]|nr:MAG: hypothetical protein Ta2B_04970 [Termitinemataceae bacterium]